jgi:hypothetical protein
MTTLAFATLCAAALLGSGLALFYLRSSAARPPHWAVAVLHGGLGAASLALLLVARSHGVPHAAMGTAGFGRAAAGLLAVALALGLLILGASWRRRRPSGALVGAHVSFAVAGLVVLWALIRLG